MGMNIHWFICEGSLSHGLLNSWLSEDVPRQVNANGDEIQKQAETKERLVRIEERQESAKDDIQEIKSEQKEQGDQLDENSLTLAKILEKVSE